MDALRVAVRRRMVADVPVGILLSGGLDSSLIVALLAEQGQRGLATFSVGFRDVGERVGDEFEFSDLVARRVRDRPPPDPGRAGAAAAGAAARDRGDERADGLPRRGRVLPALRGGRRSSARSCSRARAPTRCSAATTGTRRCSRPRATGSTSTRARSSTATTRGCARCSSERWAADGDPSRALAASWFAAPGAASAIDRGLRLDAEVMLVDDPVKRVDNMTMAHGLEARTPFLDHELVELAALLPARAQARRRRQGRAQARGARDRARRGDRPAEGLLPRARALAPRGPGARAGRRRAAVGRGARRAGCSGTTSSRQMLAAPNEHRTNLDGSTLWQLGLLELWLQEHVD